MGLVQCLMDLEEDVNTSSTVSPPKFVSLRIGFIRQLTRHTHAYDGLDKFISNLCLVKSEFALNSCLAKHEFT